ncbi:MAG: hypothetical protein M1142_03755 [Patescibacteria group bacterium]|nr:hypothetical protein [Patescibacteria group bacterium]
MQRTILQVPLTKDLKNSAEAAAQDYGFSSLQEILRVFMKKLADRKIDLSFQEDVTYLSPQSDKRYKKITKDFKKGRNIYRAKNANDLLKQLHENKLP